MYRRLTIDGTIVDLPQSGLTYSLVYEVDDEGFVSGAYSKRSIELPSTGVNDALFDDWYAAGTNNELTAPTLKPFVFEDGGVQILSGQAELQSAILMSDRYRYKARNYKVDLYGTNADWTIRMKDLKLRDLDFTPAVLDTATVIQGWSAMYNSGDYFGFTLIKWKEWNTAGEVGIDEFTPFLFIRSIIDKAFDTIGYTLVSSFFDSDIFKRMILPLPMPERYPEEFSQDYINVELEEPGTNVSSTNITYVFPNYQQPNLSTPYNVSTGYYTCPFTGYYQIQLSATVTSTTGTWGAFFAATINNNTFPELSSILDLNPGGPGTGNAAGNVVSDVLFLNAGDLISMVHVFGPSDPSTIFTINMNIIGEAEYAFGSILQFKYLTKNWKVLDLIKGLQHMFNLRFEANPQNATLKIEPADPYLYRQDNAPTTVPQTLETGFYQVPKFDSTQTLDLEVAAELINVNDIDEVTIFSYITDSPSETAAETDEPLGIFSAQYTLPQDRFNEKTTTIENPFFAKTIHTNDRSIQGATAITSLQIPLIYPQDYQLDPTATEIDSDIEPRVLYFVGFRGLQKDSTVNYNFTGGIDLAPPLSFMVNYNNAADFQIGFGREFIEGQQVPGLFESFWLQEYARKRIGKRLEAYMFWDLLTINSLSFQNKLLIDGLEWVLQKIDGYSAQSDSSTKTILLMEQGPTDVDLSSTTYSNIIGIINPIEG
jgi:hypothetical protein